MGESSIPSSETRPPIHGGVALEYAPKPPGRRWKRIVKWTAVVILLIGLTYAGQRYGPTACHFARVYYWYHRCLSFDPPPDAVVYERFAAGAPRPATRPPYEDAGEQTTDQVKRLIGANSELAAIPNEVDRVPICWDRWQSASYGWPGGGIIQGEAVIFCPSLVSPAGHTRLVCLTYPGEKYLGGIASQSESLEITVLGPPVWSMNAQSNLYFKEINEPFTWESFPLPRRIFAGQRDPNDPSHFMFELETNDGVRHIVDGRLIDETEIRLTLRVAPSTTATARENDKGMP